jgi:hypothetical protein
MSTLADSVALEAIIVASIVVPAVILASVCWIFYRATEREGEATRAGSRASTGTKDTLAAGTGDRHQVVVADEDTQVRAALQTRRDPAVTAQGRSRLRRGRACDPPKPRREGRRSGGSEHPNHAGDRLSRVDVVFEVASERYPLDERAATRLAENLRVKAAHEPDAEGTTGARAVADAIERRLIEDTADPITLVGDEAEAVFYAPEVPTGGSVRLLALHHAVKRLHDERIR